MRIQYVNDLHMEFGHTPVLNRVAGAEVLTVAGDITNWQQRWNGVDWLTDQAEHFEKVFFVLGNHEYYGAPEFREVEKFWAEADKKMPKNVHFLRAGYTHIYRDTMFLGDTLWTQVLDPVKRIYFPLVMTDATVCPGLTIERLNEQNLRAREEFANDLMVANVQGYKTFMLTHHMPTEAITTKQWRGNDWNCFFANAPGWAEELEVDYWHFGHTHDTINTLHEGTHYMCNPYGYHRRAVNGQYDAAKVVDV